MGIMPYIDLDSGTILNGPIVWMDSALSWAYEIEELSDSGIIAVAQEHGEPVGPASEDRD